jgi:1,4-dihydroxy-2-naphthoate octaprenyltransferase
LAPYQTRASDPVHAWVLASRPRTLPAAVAPVLVGTALAFQAGSFKPLATVAALAAALLIQVGTNYANDLGDFRKGADVQGRVGPTRVTSAGLLSPRAVTIGMCAAFGLAAACGLYLIYLGGWPIALIGAASILAGVAYTAGPLPLGYYGLGDLAAFIFFGPVAVIGTYYVQALNVTALAGASSLPIGALVTAILVVNNLRDAGTDRLAGKRTLAVLLGQRGARVEYVLLIAAAYVTPVLLWRLFGLSAWVLLPLLTLPLAARQTRAVTTTLGPALNRNLAGTAQLAVVYAVSLSVGLVL